MTKEELIAALKEMDLKLRPYIIFGNSIHYLWLHENFDNKAKIIVNDIIEPDQFYVVHRADVEILPKDLVFDPEPSPVRPIGSIGSIEPLGAWCGNYHVLSCPDYTMTATVDAIRLDPEGGVDNEDNSY